MDPQCGEIGSLHALRKQLSIILFFFKIRQRVENCMNQIITKLEIQIEGAASNGSSSFAKLVKNKASSSLEAAMVGEEGDESSLVCLCRAVYVPGRFNLLSKLSCSNAQQVLSLQVLHLLRVVRNLVPWRVRQGQ